MEPILVVLGLCAVAIPIATVFLLWRQFKLREQLLRLTDLTMEVTDGLRRDLLELKHQVEAAQPQPPATNVPAAAVPKSVAAPIVATPPVRQAASVVTPPVERKPDIVAPAAHKEDVVQPVTPQVPTTIEPLLSQQAPTLIPEAARKEEPKEEAQKPLPGPHIPPVTPSASATPPPLSRTQMPPAELPSAPVVAPPPPPPPPPPPIRVAAAPPIAPLRAAAPKRTWRQRMNWLYAAEEMLSANLGKVGIVLAVFGVASFGIYELGQLGPRGKTALSYAVSFALLGGGIFLEKRDRYRILGHTLIGGGWALLFFTTFAINHVAAMHVMSSETTDLILMLIVALAMVMHTLRYRSQVVTGLAFLLAYGTVALSTDDVYSLASGVILALGLVVIVIKMGWFELEVFGILSTYLNHAYWLYRLLGPGGAQGHDFADYHASTAILLFYWITYRSSYVVRRPKTPLAEHVSTAAALLNTLLLLGVMKFQSVHPELAFIALLLIGAMEFSLGQIPVTRRRREAFVVLSVLGAALMVAAVPFRYSGNNVDILWLVGAEVLLAAGVAVAEVVFRRLALFTGLLVGLHLAAIDFPELVSARRINENILLTVGVIFGLCAVVFYLNLLFIGRRWRSFFIASPDSELLCAHSYVGGFAAACAAWALSSADWTALAFAGIMLALAVLGQKLKSLHLQVQYVAIGLLSVFRIATVNLHIDAPLNTHITARLISLPLLAAAFYITAKFAAANAESTQRTFRGVFAFAGTALVTALISYEVPELWQPFAAIAFAVLLLEVGQAIAYPVLAWHAHLLTGLSILAAVTSDQAGIHRWHNIPVHSFAALPVVAGAYWIAHRINLLNSVHVKLGRIAYTWAGTGVMTWVLYEATPESWIAVSWIIFAIALALVMRRLNFSPLGWQANAVAACALVRAFSFNLELEQPFLPGISLRLATIAIVATGLYFLSRKATPAGAEIQRPISYLHTTAATGLLAFLAWHEAPSGWLAAVWAIFALVLTLVDRRFELEDIRWQAHALAALAMARSVTVNLYVTDTWHGLSLRLLSLAIVAVVFYAMSQLIRMPERLRQRDYHHIYSWAASALVSLLMWYELQPLSVAVGWAVFGLVLFEYGLSRKTQQFRFQAYLALAASFVRIFFANLTAGDPGEFWGPRIYTVLPIIAILIFVYAQLGSDEEAARDDRGFRLDVLLAYLGTGAVVALLYFQFPNDWLVTAWAVVVFALFGVSLLLNRPIFLHHALLLTLGACTRGIMHNLFGASYFSGGDWTGRYFVLGSAIAVLLACLPFAFQWRDRQRAQPAGNWMRAVIRHPEQFMFFAPVLLLTLMLALKMRAGMVTVAWGLEGLLIVVLALAVKERSFRLTGLALLLLCVAKVVVRDAWNLQIRDRYITFIILGIALWLVQFLYTKYRDTVRQFL